MSRPRGGDRGQARTLEAIAGAFILVGTVLFVVQSAVVTPLTASTANQFLEDRQETLADDMLRSATTNGSVREAVLYWDTTRKRFNGSGGNGYTDPPNIAFGEALQRTFEERRVAYNVYFRFRTTSNTSRQVAFVYQGAPSNNAVAASTYVTLYDDAELTAPANPGVAIGNTTAFYASDVSDTTVYNIVEVRIVVWQS